MDIEVGLIEVMIIGNYQIHEKCGLYISTNTKDEKSYFEQQNSNINIFWIIVILKFKCKLFSFIFYFANIVSIHKFILPVVCLLRDIRLCIEIVCKWSIHSFIWQNKQTVNLTLCMCECGTCICMYVLDFIYKINPFIFQSWVCF